MGPLQKQWVADLRSGEYAQGRSRLRSRVVDNGLLVYSYSYCCLGVACCRIEDGNLESGYFGEYERYGLRNSQGCFAGQPVVDEHACVAPIHALTGLNDTLHWTFEQIADFIEERESDIFIKEV